MFQKKKIILKYSPLALAAEVLCFILIMAVMYITVTYYPDTPARIPSRFDAMGAAVEWAARETALLQPILAVFLYVVLTGIGVLVRRAVPENDQRGFLPPILLALLGIKGVYLAYAVEYTFCVMRAERVPEWAFVIMPVGFAVTVCLCALSVCKRYKLRKSGEQ